MVTPFHKKMSSFLNVMLLLKHYKDYSLQKYFTILSHQHVEFVEKIRSIANFLRPKTEFSVRNVNIRWKSLALYIL